jgi:hypothetical protein
VTGLMAGVRRSARLRLTSRRANALGVGVVNSLELIRAGPVALVSTRKSGIKYKKPLQQFVRFDSAFWLKADVCRRSDVSPTDEITQWPADRRVVTQSPH